MWLLKAISSTLLIRMFLDLLQRWTIYTSPIDEPFHQVKSLNQPSEKCKIRYIHLHIGNNTVGFFKIYYYYIVANSGVVQDAHSHEAIT